LPWPRADGCAVRSQKMLGTAEGAGRAPAARPGPGQARSPVARLVWQGAAAGGLLVAWWIWLRLGHAEESSRRAVSDVGVVFAPAVAGWCGLRVARRAPEAARAWRWLAAGCGTWALASVVWVVYELALGRLAPFPSYADVGYIGYVIPMAVGLRLLPRASRLRTSRLRSNLDAAVIMSSLLFLSWSLVLRMVFRAPAAHQWYRMDAMAYPGVDAVLVTLVLVVGARYAVHRRLSWSLLAVGLVTLALTDSAYAVASVNGTYTTGTSFDLLWIGAFVLIALAAEAASHPRANLAAADRLNDLIAETAPYVPLAAAVVVTAVTRVTPATHPVGFALGCVLFVLASARQVVLVVEQRRLTDHLDAQVLERTEALAGSETRMRALLANLSDAVMIMEPHGEGRLSYVSPALGTLLGAPLEQFSWGAQLTERLHPDDVTRSARMVQAVKRATVPQHWQVRLAHPDGRWRTIEVTATNLVSDPAINGLVLVLHDVTERERLQQELRFLAGHDPLTGLGNRRFLNEQMPAVLARADRRGERIALILLDLDGFKAVNDTLGHTAGDELLILAGQRLLACTRAGDLICRLGGDEFAVLLDPTDPTGGTGDDLSDVFAVGERILATLREPFLLGRDDRQPLQLSASAGIAIRQPGGTQAGGELLREADLAMYAVKASGKDGLRIFDPTMQDTTLTRLALHQQIRLGLRDQEFVVDYQPVFDIATGSIHGLEALARWQHPRRGLLHPAEFIAAAETSGLIVAMGAHVLRIACAQLRSWQLAGAATLTISVNVSPRQLTTALTEEVVQVLRDHELSPSSLVLEITESLLIGDLPPCLSELTDLGVRLSVDDFGTGYSSLSRLRSFPVHELKIDQSFVADVASDPRSGALAVSIIDLAHTLNLQVVAEGVEDAAQLAFLRQHGCDLAQGFLLSRPVGADKISELLAEQNLTRGFHGRFALPTNTGGREVDQLVAVQVQVQATAGGDRRRPRSHHSPSGSTP